ncbi:amidohydrolase family protein [Propylenella binzhouense]|uniref:Amidohydrolase n=1 Tax=Propylenella binzhouense TaxID=2555902 RepID=A0A964WW41_9HYPH|nr:amidohydrolase family protein [Propylenella binzhouense]MYZ50480.1 amidohydrolase [Propylenella binzhouense]
MPDRLAKLRPGPLDIHAHIVPRAFMDRLASGDRPGFGVELQDGRRHLVIGGKAMKAPVLPGMDSMEIRFRTMEEMGVAAQLVSPWIALANYALPEADGVWFAEELNRAIADAVRAEPDRLVGIGSVPLQAPGKAVEMMRWLVRDLGLLGVEINTSVSDKVFLDDPSLEPFWAEAEALGAFVSIHPSLGGSSGHFARYYLNNLIHNPLETTVAAAHLIFGGVMERHPGLKILLVHGGGFLQFDIGRLRRGRLVRPETQVAMQGSVEDSAARFYYDTVTHSASLLRYLVGEAGAARVLLGSDYPFDMADPLPVATVKEAALSSADEALVLRGSAEKLLS